MHAAYTENQIINGWFLETNYENRYTNTTVFWLFNIPYISELEAELETTTKGGN